MSAKRVPSVAEMLRLPAGDRGPRLRSLEQHCRASLAAMDAGPSEPTAKAWRTRYTRNLAKLAHVAQALGLNPRPNPGTDGTG